jgi:hypothetical protein
MNRSVEVAKATHSEDASSIPEYPSCGGRRIGFVERKLPGVKVRKIGADARRHRDFQSAASILHEIRVNFWFPSRSSGEQKRLPVFV